jgi:hypothetical protein
MRRARARPRAARRGRSTQLPRAGERSVAPATRAAELHQRRPPRTARTVPVHSSITLERPPGQRFAGRPPTRSGAAAGNLQRPTASTDARPVARLHSAAHRINRACSLYSATTDRHSNRALTLNAPAATRPRKLIYVR